MRKYLITLILSGVSLACCAISRASDFPVPGQRIRERTSINQLTPRAAPNCTDYWVPGVINQTYVAGHTYCPNSAANPYLFNQAQAVSASNVTIYCSNNGMVLKRTGATDLFDFSGNSDSIIGCTLDGNSQTAAGTGPLVNMTGNFGLATQNLIQNAGVTASTVTGTIAIQNGNDNVVSYNTFSGSQLDQAIYVQPLSADTIQRPIVDHNKIPTFAPSTSLSGIWVDVPGTSQHVWGIQVTNNDITSTTANAVGYTLEQTSINPTTMDWGWVITGNKSTAASHSVTYLYKLFAVESSVFANNIADDGGQGAQIAFDFGDVYQSTIANNTGKVQSAVGTCFSTDDYAHDVFANNVCDGAQTGGTMYTWTGVNSATGNLGDTIITGNVARPIWNNAGTITGVAATCYNILNGSASTIQQNISFIGNACYGTGTASQIGFSITTGSGTVNDVLYDGNVLGNLPTGFNIAGASSVHILDTQHFHTVTTLLTDTGTGTDSPVAGVTAPTITAGCTAGGGNAVAGTDYHGVITTGATAATTCTMTFNHTWPKAPNCVFSDANASITPVSYSAGAIGTTTAVVDFASAGSKKIAYSCR